MERRLRQEARYQAAMHLCGVYEERMAEIDVTGIAGCQRLRPRQLSCELMECGVRHSCVAGRFE